ncbi:MAG TPA: amidohydrolase family protein [Tahibacter sp.]|uniref:amidohydrolase n=1 Tax=Tahibacter sp. TaxID=2056211 RepID=UPI002B78DE50|nr:amidohydrolase family protein [Tahibacter sp.]HSX60805.1 amidohydrolase family protein [Tahibacter sp.]
MHAYRFGTFATLFGSILLLAGCAASTAPRGGAARAGAAPPDVIIVDTNVVTLAASPAPATAQALAITAGRITAIGTSAQIRALAGPGTQTYVPPPGTSLLPGFIDPHSHMSAVGFYSDTAHWLDVSSVNLLFKPLPDDAACSDRTDPQTCFIPVRNQDDVVARLKKAVAAVDPAGATPYVLAFNYDPSRLGRSKGCKGLAFQCTNFENGKARAQLDAISRTVPIVVGSESGHIVYVNTPALKLLNICKTPGATKGCYTPTTNPAVETALAIKGQLDEDLALYAIGYFQGKVLKANHGLGNQLLLKAAQIYAQHGYTLAQEGAAALDLMLMYVAALDSAEKRAAFPVSVALIAYDAASDDYTKTIDAAKAVRDALAVAPNPLLDVAAVKTFADGSTQGYTAYMNEPYLKLFPPFTDRALFRKQPYLGLPDVDEPTMAQRLGAAHEAGFPMLIHQNGDAATADAVAALATSAPPAGKRDVVIHAPMIDAAQLAALNPQQVAISFLMPNVYFYGLPECQQVLGPGNSLNMYPIASAAKAGLTTTLHTDSPVTPPAPLFAIWAAATRQAQQPSWYPNLDAKNCPVTMSSDGGLGPQAVSILQGVQAYTVNAAWQYGQEADRGTLEVGKFADIVMLSANPLDLESTPDRLRNVRILGTYSQGRQFLNPAPERNWPD